MTDEQLTISIDRGAKAWALFDQANNVLFGFRKYEDEALALADAKATCGTFSTCTPEVVYPYVKSIKITRSRR